ncbi:hypothetical protein BOX15_Mlig015855g1 [Macrostomum lignano]|uniref:EGF-like domain-containing protein n=1 Tax=Macrostomum lignano TaxID=282301 RepID=A0A267DMH1_9PLAT|nr:hypothetical protein BOX15_Mlig015855g1 [Macrostomum lignano]
MHPKLRQLQHLQDRQRQRWRRRPHSRTAAAAAAMAGVYTDSGRLLLGGMAVGLLSLLLTFAGLQLARLGGLRHPAEPEAPVESVMNRTLRGAENRPATVASPTDGGSGGDGGSGSGGGSGGDGGSGSGGGSGGDGGSGSGGSSGGDGGSGSGGGSGGDGGSGSGGGSGGDGGSGSGGGSGGGGRSGSGGGSGGDGSNGSNGSSGGGGRSGSGSGSGGGGRSGSGSGSSGGGGGSGNLKLNARNGTKGRPLPLPGTSDRPKFFFNESLLRRQRRYQHEYILFVNNQGGYDGERWWYCFRTDTCWGYRQGQGQAVASYDMLQRCTFSRNYQYEVPIMISKFNPLKRLYRYRHYAKKIPRYLWCFKHPWSGDCHSWWRYSSYDTGYPAGYNDIIVQLLVDMNYHDYIATGAARTAILNHLMVECRILYSTLTHSNKPYYKNPAPTAYATVLAYYGRCIYGYPKYCPDPCKNPHACSGDNMLSSCYAIVPPNRHEENKYQKQIADEFKALKKIFARVAYCTCTSGFKYNIETEVCELLPFKCRQDSECLNNGRCEGVSPEIEQLIGRSYNCKCPPAWQGLRCEEARDPCLEPDNRASCGDFECRRSPTDSIYGFVCICSTGFTLTRQQGKPSCRDINECAVSAPCRNGGECHNLQGSFECICSRSYSGSLCEIPPPEPYWMDWGPWTECSVTCSVGLQHRQRNCSLESSCVGSKKDFKTCLGRHMDCVLASLGDVSVEELAGGAGWRAEEDNILDDAWYFREFQLLRLGLNNRFMAEDEFVSDLEDVLDQYIHIIALAGVVQAAVLLLLCKRIRVQVRQ